VVQAKLAEYGAVMAWHETFADDNAAVSAALRRMKEQGAELIICTGGMSVDPDDRHPSERRERRDLRRAGAARRDVPHGLL